MAKKKNTKKSSNMPMKMTKKMQEEHKKMMKIPMKPMKGM